MIAISDLRSEPRTLALPTYLTILIPLTTLSFVVWGFWIGTFSEAFQLALFLTGMLISGIPHGAVDHLVYMHSTGQKPNFKRFLHFYLRVMALYSLLWLVLPGASLLFFLGLSFYHFGQSQLSHIQLPEKSYLKKSLYFAWGMFLLLAMIGLNWEESRVILEGLGSYPGKTWIVMVSPEIFYFILTGLFVINGLILIYMQTQNYLASSQLIMELGAMILLFGLCYYCPLKIAFTIYFALWHAPQAIQTEVVSLRQVYPQFGWGQFFIKALPFSLISFAGIALLIWIAWIWQSQISPYLLFFISISILTLPHMLVMESVYEQQELEYTS